VSDDGEFTWLPGAGIIKDDAGGLTIEATDQVANIFYGDQLMAALFKQTGPIFAGVDLYILMIAEVDSGLAAIDDALQAGGEQLLIGRQGVGLQKG